MYTILYDLVLRTRIQHFSDLRRKYDNMCLSAHGCYFFSSEEYNYSDIGGYGFSLFYMQLHTYMCACALIYIYIYTHTHTYGGVFPLRYRVWKNILNSINLK